MGSEVSTVITGLTGYWVATREEFEVGLHCRLRMRVMRSWHSFGVHWHAREIEGYAGWRDLGSVSLERPSGIPDQFQLILSPGLRKPFLVWG